MAVHYRTEGLILKKLDRGEADRIFTVFTRDFGKLKLRAVSERKITSKLRGGLEMFYLSEVEFIQGKIQKTLTDATVQNSHLHVRKDLKKLRVAYRVSEIFDAVVKGQEPDENIWRLLREVFSFLSHEELDEKSIRLVPYYFLWNLLSYAGYKPQFKDMEAQSREMANIVQNFLQGDIVQALQKLQGKDIDGSLLKKISQEYLSRVLGN